jgi:hypothetical protein
MRVSTVAFGAADTDLLEPGSEIVATRNATTRIGRNDFMERLHDAGPFYASSEIKMRQSALAAFRG